MSFLEILSVVLYTEILPSTYFQLAIEYSVRFMETSAKASINVEESFVMLARDIKAKMDKKLVIIIPGYDVTHPIPNQHLCDVTMAGSRVKTNRHI